MDFLGYAVHEEHVYLYLILSFHDAGHIDVRHKTIFAQIDTVGKTDIFINL